MQFGSLLHTHESTRSVSSVSCVNNVCGFDNNMQRLSKDMFRARFASDLGLVVVANISFPANRNLASGFSLYRL